ncbi:hypothetical protein CcCBS67573_g01755 [Chytriomyces confervae]|uniref:Vacuolar protein 8 n=1 Tax=Chytriomyces confervae TaxID=246404 RepID=A0A507FL67_9FUNG|nr:hypothetical protein CcCBS67573_g01755 [Chytriomyces confervae]
MYKYCSKYCCSAWFGSASEYAAISETQPLNATLNAHPGQSFPPELAAAVAVVDRDAKALSAEDFFSSRSSFEAFSLLVYSPLIEAQRVAASAFVDVTERDAVPVNSHVIDCGVFLLKSRDHEIQRGSAAALGNLAVIANNQTLIVIRGALEHLVSIMATGDSDAQCNAVGCITNLATHDENKDRIARSGALDPLVKLALSSDLRVQRNATGALLNMTHTIDNRHQLVAAGAIPILVQLLNSPDYDVQYYSTTSLSNIAVDVEHRIFLAKSEPSIVASLIRLTDSPALKVQCQATLALRNLASDEYFQLEIVKHNGLVPLHHLLQSRIPQIILAAVACIRNISIHPNNETPIVHAKFLPQLLELLSIDNLEIQCHAMSTIRNLASSDENKIKIFQAGAVERIGDLLRLKDGIVNDSVKSEMTACLAVLALVDEVKPSLFRNLKYLIRLTLTTSNIDVKTNAAAAIGNCATNLSDAKGLAVFQKYWKEIRKYVITFMSCDDVSLQHIGIWTLVQLISGNEELKMKIASDATLLNLIEEVGQKQKASLHQNGSARGSQGRNETQTETVNSMLLGSNYSAEELSHTLLQELHQ